MEYISPRQIWDAVLGELQLQVSKSNYRTWLEKTTGLERHDNQFVVGVPNAFVAEYLDKNQRSLIEKTLIGIVRDDIQVTFQVNGRIYAINGDTFTSAKPGLNANYTFNSFIVGGNNQLAYAASREVAENPGKTYNPFFICGGHGLGKTHLLQAIGHEALSRNLHVLYASGEQYTNEFLGALRERRTDEFRNKYRSADMLLIDDIDFVTGKEQTEESLFHTLDELQNANRQIAVTSDRALQQMPHLSGRLRSRLEGGLVADIQSPEYDTRLAILKAKARQKGIEITADTLEVIAQNIRQNIREMEGSLNRVVAYAKLIRDAITPELAARALESVGNQTPAQPFNARLIIEAVAESFRLSSADLISPKRDKDTALARQMAMYVMKQEMNCSLAQIGKELGGRNPATITHGCQKIAGDLTSNAYLQERLNDIQGKISKLNTPQG
ncbi:MAG: chromosomal replication initiator protein DnaA [Dehalococcoidales bacterium]|nr:chromosomal replication initiator protein DnaA [Dehalococcoidales bacterium]